MQSEVGRVSGRRGSCSWASASGPRAGSRRTRAWLSGLAVGSSVDEHMQTSDPDIYAVGDAAEIKDFVTGEPVQIPLAGPANRQGRIAADHIFGRDSRSAGTQGTAILRLVRTDRRHRPASPRSRSSGAGLPYRKVYVHPNQHAGYYPGARADDDQAALRPATSGTLLGAQVVGEEGVDKRIDVLAVAIQAGMTVFDLEEVELAYSPQYGSAKDAINMAGFVAAGLLRGDHPQIDAESILDARAVSGAFLLDVRAAEEFAAWTYSRGSEYPRRRAARAARRDSRVTGRSRPTVRSGQRGYLATCILLQSGFSAVNVGRRLRHLPGFTTPGRRGRVNA